MMKRGNTFHLRRRVPQRYRSVESRPEVWISLRTDSETFAKSKAEGAWAQLIAVWEARLAGDSEGAAARYAAVQKLANLRGFAYLDAGALAGLPVSELVERAEAVEAPTGQPDLIEAAALLGAADKPKILISDALELYWTYARERTLGKSADQVRRWENPRKKAVRNFIAISGDKAMDEITRDDMLDFRQHWLERIEAGEVTPNSGNKDLIHLGDILKTINTMKRLHIDLPLGDLSFREGEKRTRPPFSSEWIKTKIIAPGALDGLNEEARGIVLGMVNTGYRPSEAAALSGKSIRLDHKVPHICIEPEGRQLKTRYARRVIPLTGVSLEAFKQFPDGFPRYRHNSASLSGAVNKFFEENGLRETPDHSFYSLRHSFEDRMLEAGIDDRIRRDLFGHALDRERYGKGASLEHVQKLVLSLAF